MARHQWRCNTHKEVGPPMNAMAPEPALADELLVGALPPSAVLTATWSAGRP
jgi:hypothetical protein